MERKTADFIRALLELCPILNSTFTDCVLYWLPEVPPSTILLGILGERLVVEFDDFTESERIKIFELIERGATDDSDTFAEAVVTGLIEGIVTETDRSVGSWEKVSHYFGASSFFHAEAWRKWGSA
jgi:hypothetical protein